MQREIEPSSRGVLWQIESLGYRTEIGAWPDDSPRSPKWIATAKRDRDGQFHLVKADDERTVVAELARLVGIDLMNG